MYDQQLQQLWKDRAHAPKQSEIVQHTDLDDLKEELLSNLERDKSQQASIQHDCRKFYYSQIVIRNSANNNKEDERHEINRFCFTQEKLFELINEYLEGNGEVIINVNKMTTYCQINVPSAKRIVRKLLYYRVLHGIMRLVKNGRLARIEKGTYFGYYCLPEKLEQLQNYRTEHDLDEIIDGISCEIEQTIIKDKGLDSFKPIQLSKWAKRYRDDPDKVKGYFDKYRKKHRTRINSNARKWRKKNRHKALASEFNVKSRAQLAKEIIQANPVIFLDGVLQPPRQIVHKASQILQAIADTK